MAESRTMRMLKPDGLITGIVVTIEGIVAGIVVGIVVCTVVTVVGNVPKKPVGPPAYGFDTEMVDLGFPGIVIEFIGMLLRVTGAVAESVMIIFADIVFPMSIEGTCQENALLVAVIPVYRAFASNAPVVVLNTW